ncbi:sporulation lipoprotein YhcN/YlaJ [Cytobacillus firmus]|uniref:Sporulation lipoprotein YhcN/YlaJ n=2 Tax=Cytobacillus TaxID=2675230 RepID=A0A366JIY3_CYTFI|nr:MULTISPECIES: YhcN/YlaJ family sporulation lipoprotein [Cytobacillus]RBP86288.1 sporulation lipoprotein YhcN/YlaJ [Cytobacillus firmus]TDX34538.1 sporulation lipoprotein YhcN/YlaJ [Cytobacillus oceanisediminis]
MKDKITKLKISFLLLTAIGLCSGCAGNQKQFTNNNDDASVVKVHTKKPIDQSIANEVKEKVIKREEISSAKAVNTDKELLLAVKVDNFDRFRLKEIEKKVKSDLKEEYTDYKILVSTDSKMYMELEQLEHKLQEDKIKMKALKKEFDTIKSLMKEKT